MTLMDAKADQQNPAPAGNKTIDSQTKESEAEQPVTWQFHAEDPVNNESGSAEEAASSLSPSRKNLEPVTWTASEYIAHEKSVLWYLVLALTTAALSTGIYFINHDKISVGVVILVALIFGIYAARKPRVL